MVHLFCFIQRLEHFQWVMWHISGRKVIPLDSAWIMYTKNAIWNKTYTAVAITKSFFTNTWETTCKT